MKYQKLFRQGIAVALTTSMLLTGCASGNADNTNADVEQKTETENGTEDLLKHANRMNRKLIFVMDILQIPLSIVFTRFLNVFSSI